MRNWWGRKISPKEEEITHQGAADESAEHSHEYRLEPLEPRLLLSADPVSAEMARVAQEQIQQSEADAVAAIVQEADLFAESEAAAVSGGDQAGVSFNWPAEWQAEAGESENNRVDLQVVLTELIGNAHALLQAGENAGTLRLGISTDNFAPETGSQGADQAESTATAADEHGISEELIGEVLDNVVQGLETSAQTEVLADLKVELVDLEGDLVAEIRGDTLYIDVDAAGNGWVCRSGTAGTGRKRNRKRAKSGSRHGCSARNAAK